MAIRYHKYIGELWDELELGDLVDELSDFLLDSGFGTEGADWDADHLQSLHDAIMDTMTAALGVVQRTKLSEEQYETLIRPFLAVGADVPIWGSDPV